ncbi:hypothetical protein KRR38_25070 [Novosphingobium sp. G106]|uniref:hypothetical protein n=1 Tax=Novosphingobium sp. G106 TaxID=2849500 RepID=UPI001C2CCFAA|nr:hypothetical protein [Novosphingobium sp. G106]MBV1690860.1 hypothetical protein [Novosphingobium sp. G106]
MWPFKQKQKPALRALVFKTGEAFLEYHCKFMMTRLERGVSLAALVLDPGESFGSVPVKADAEGIQTAMLRVASRDGGFVVLAQTASKGELLKPGDTVAWIAGEYIPLLAEGADDPRFGWLGLIAAKIAPEISMSKDEMTVLCHY